MNKFYIVFKLDGIFGEEVISAPNEILAWSKFEKMLINYGFATFECGCCIDWDYVFGKDIPIINEIS